MLFIPHVTHLFFFLNFGTCHITRCWTWLQAINLHIFLFKNKIFSVSINYVPLDLWFFIICILKYICIFFLLQGNRIHFWKYIQFRPDNMIKILSWTFVMKAYVKIYVHRRHCSNVLFCIWHSSKHCGQF